MTLPWGEGGLRRRYVFPKQDCLPELAETRLDPAGIGQTVSNKLRSAVNSRFCVNVGGIPFTVLLQGFALIREFLCSEMTKNSNNYIPHAGVFAIAGLANTGVHCRVQKIDLLSKILALSQPSHLKFDSSQVGNSLEQLLYVLVLYLVSDLCSKVILVV